MVLKQYGRQGLPISYVVARSLTILKLHWDSKGYRELKDGNININIIWH